MALTREAVVDAAWEILRTWGLADLSMRRLARDLDVAPGALYWHVANKQELLVALAGRMLEDVPTSGSAELICARFRAALLRVRDGADVVVVARAMNPQLTPPMPALVRSLRNSGHATPTTTASALIDLTLGSVAAQQIRQSLDSTRERAGNAAAPERVLGRVEPTPDDPDSVVHEAAVSMLLTGSRVTEAGRE